MASEPAQAVPTSRAPPVQVSPTPVAAPLVASLTAGPDVILSMQRSVGNRATTAFLARAAAALTPPPDTMEDRRQIAARKLRLAAQRGIAEAENGRWVQDDHIEKQRGVTGVVSDWLSDAEPPFIGVWTNTKQLFVRALALLEAGDLRGAFGYTVNGAKSLEEAKRAWSTYINASIAGAGEIAGTLEIVRDGAFAIEIGLISGGMTAGVLGGGALGAAGGTLMGTGMAVEKAAQSQGAVGNAVRGTLDEASKRGALGNLRLAANGAVGMAYGIGEVLGQMPDALKGMIRWLESAFRDPGRLVDDAAHFKHFVLTLHTTIKDQWEALEALPEDKQAFFIGRLAGQIEASLIAIEAGGQMGRGLGAAVESAQAGGGVLATGGELSAELVNLQATLQTLGKAGAGINAMAAVAATDASLKTPQGPASPADGSATKTGGPSGPAKPPSKKRLSLLLGMLNDVEQRFWPMARHDRATSQALVDKRKEIEGLINAQRAEEAAAELKTYEAAMREAAERQIDAGASWSRKAAGDEAVASGLTKGGRPMPLDNLEGLRKLPSALPSGSELKAGTMNVHHTPLKNGTALKAQQGILSAVENGDMLATTGGNRYEELIKKHPEALSEAAVSKSSARPGRRPDLGQVEITIEGRTQGFSQHKHQQFWSDLVDMKGIVLVVPKLCAQAADELRQLGAGAEALGIDVSITVIETAP